MAWTSLHHKNNNGGGNNDRVTTATTATVSSRSMMNDPQQQQQQSRSRVRGVISSSNSSSPTTIAASSTETPSVSNSPLFVVDQYRHNDDRWSAVVVTNNNNNNNDNNNGGGGCSTSGRIRPRSSSSSVTERRVEASSSSQSYRDGVEMAATAKKDNRSLSWSSTTSSTSSSSSQHSIPQLSRVVWSDQESSSDGDGSSGSSFHSLDASLAVSVSPVCNYSSSTAACNGVDAHGNTELVAGVFRTEEVHYHNQNNYSESLGGALRSRNNNACSTGRIKFRDNNNNNNNNNHNHPRHHPSSSSHTQQRPAAAAAVKSCFLFSSGVLFQCLLLVGIYCLVLWDRTEAKFANDKLLQLSEEEALRFLQLHRLENHSIQLHETMRKRLLRSGSDSDSDNDSSDDYFYYRADADDSAGAAGGGGDGGGEEELQKKKTGDLLFKQQQQLTEMSSELKRHASVAALQNAIQESAANEIVRAYGEGPVKVVIELDFTGTPPPSRGGADGGTTISIMLWPDAPHAAWTWLEEIENRIWDRSVVEWDSASTLLRFSTLTKTTMSEDRNGGGGVDGGRRRRLEFVERHPYQQSNPNYHHGPWTVGLRETLVGKPGEDNDSNDEDDDDTAADDKTRLEMYINLSNNWEERKHETCVGKIVSGFDALRELIESTRFDVVDTRTTTTTTTTTTGEGGKNSGTTGIVTPRLTAGIKSVTAEHVTNRELAMHYRSL